MSLDRWLRVAVFAAFFCSGCGGAVEAGDEHAATKAQALVASIPGRIEAESYERSLDSTPDVNFGAYVTECDRKDGVDIDRSDDSNDGGCVIGWTTAGEWLEYDIQAPSAQIVDITARVASNLPDRQFHISVDGNSLAEQTLSADTSWGYTNATYPGVTLSAGAHVLRFTFDSDAIDVNYIDVTASSPSANAGPPVSTLLPAASVVASSQESDLYPPSFAIDGDSSTRWSSQFNDPQWIYEDLGATEQVSRVILNWEVAASRSYEIDVSDDSDGPWTTVYSTTTGDGGFDDISFTPVAARYVRMYSTARTTYFGVSLYDFDVFGVATPDPSCVPDISAAPDDGANVPTGVPSVPTQYGGSSDPTPVLVPSWVAPDGKGCPNFTCINGSVLDGNTLVTASNPSFQPGSVSIYVKGADGTWSRQAQLFNPVLGPYTNDPGFGSALALSGDDLFVGSYYGIGELYVYVRSGTSWSLKQTLTPNRQNAQPILDHGTALIATATGVRVYQRGANGLYRLQSIFDKPPNLSGPFVDEGFGEALALDKNVAVVGAPNGGGSDEPEPSLVYVYERCGTVWYFAQQLAAPNGLVGSDFGAAVSVSGTQIAVGEQAYPGTSNFQSGAVETFILQTSQWLPDQFIADPIVDDGSPVLFGTALALHNHLLLIGYVEENPFLFGGYNTLYDVNGAPRFLALVSGGNSETAQISGHEALLNPYGRRGGTDPEVFDLPY